MIERDLYSRIGKHHPNRLALFPRRRSGLATGWLLLFGPAFIVVLYTALEIGHIYLACTELRNALEAAALAGVKGWKDSASTSIARDYAQAYAAANTVSGDPLILERNEGPGVNGNLICTGDIVLGAVDGTCGAYTFDPDSPPSAITGVYVDLKVEVQTVANTFNDVSTGHYSFRIYDFYADDAVGPAPPANQVNTIEIASVTFDLSTVVGGTTPGFFDLRDKTGGGIGLGADKNNGLEPIFAGTNVGSVPPVLGTDYVYSPLFVAGNTTTTSSTFSVGFPTTTSDPFQPNQTPSDEFAFGVDTDDVGPPRNESPPPAGGQKDEIDWGGDFDNARVTVVFRDTVTGDTGSITGFLVYIDYATSRVEFVDEMLGGGNFGVRTQKQWPITPLCSSLLGIPLNDYYVSGEATAAIESGSTEPKLIRVVNYLCP